MDKSQIPLCAAGSDRNYKMQLEFEFLDTKEREAKKKHG